MSTLLCWKKNILAQAAAAALALAAPSYGEAVGVALKPEGSLLGGDEFNPPYLAILTQAFQEAYDSKFVLRAVVLPSSKPEFAVGLKDNLLFGLFPRNAYWAYALAQDMSDADRSRFLASLPKSFKDVPINRCSVSLEPATTKKITELWATMLKRTHYPPPENDLLVVGGTYYHFSNNLMMAGEISSPPENSSAGRLVDITYKMVSVCQSHGETLDELTGKIDALLADLRKDPAAPY